MTITIIIWMVVVIALIFLIFGVLNFVSKKRKSPSKEEVAIIIENFISGKGSDWEWDDFISCPINDLRLEKVRYRCASLDEEFPAEKSGEFCNAEGIKVLKDYVLELRSGI